MFVNNLPHNKFLRTQIKGSATQVFSPCFQVFQLINYNNAGQNSMHITYFTYKHLYITKLQHFYYLFVYEATMLGYLFHESNIYLWQNKVMVITF